MLFKGIHWDLTLTPTEKMCMAFYLHYMYYIIQFYSCPLYNFKYLPTFLWNTGNSKAFFSSTSSLLSIDFFVHLSVCGATYLSINVGPQIVMGNRRLFSFVSGASNSCQLPRGRKFIVAEQTMCDYTYVLLNSKWTTWWLPCSCSLQSCVCTGRSDEMKRLAVVILLSSVSQSALSANARFF